MALIPADFLATKPNVLIFDANQLHNHFTNTTSLINTTVITNTVINSSHYNISRATSFAFVDFTRTQFEDIIFKTAPSPIAAF
jgi:hypothetical protein